MCSWFIFYAIRLISILEEYFDFSGNERSLKGALRGLFVVRLRCRRVGTKSRGLQTAKMDGD